MILPVTPLFMNNIIPMQIVHVSRKIITRAPVHAAANK